MTFSVLIVDDEDIARCRIAEMLREMETPFRVTEARNAIEAGELLPVCQPDLIFLDINMPVQSGVEFVRQHNLDTCKIIFQTAHSDHAIEAFEVGAENYLLKPFTRQRFFAATQRAIDKISQQAVDKYLEFVSITIAGQGRQIPCVEIESFSTREKTCYLQWHEKELSCGFTLKELEAKLDPKKYLRVHRNTIVNIALIETWSNTYPMSIKMKSGREIQVSKERRKQVKDVLTSIE